MLVDSRYGVDCMICRVYSANGVQCVLCIALGIRSKLLCSGVSCGGSLVCYGSSVTRLS